MNNPQLVYILKYTKQYIMFRIYARSKSIQAFIGIVYTIFGEKREEKRMGEEGRGLVLLVLFLPLKET